MKDNVPYDQFVRDLLTASGSNFAAPQVNFYRALQSKTPQAIAQAVALTFMGNADEKWPKSSGKIRGVFLECRLQVHAEWKEEIIYFDPASTNAQAVPARRGRRPFPDGTTVQLSPDKDPRAVFADWLVGAEKSLVRAEHRQPRVVVAAGPRHHSGAGRHPPGQSARAIRNCSRIWKRNSSRPATI